MCASQAKNYIELKRTWLHLGPRLHFDLQLRYLMSRFLPPDHIWHSERTDNPFMFHENRCELRKLDHPHIHPMTFWLVWLDVPVNDNTSGAGRGMMIDHQYDGLMKATTEFFIGNQDASCLNSILDRMRPSMLADAIIIWWHNEMIIDGQLNGRTKRILIHTSSLLSTDSHSMKDGVFSLSCSLEKKKTKWQSQASLPRVRRVVLKVVGAL